MTGPAEGRVWDRGLQPERTSLAWRRAALGFLGLGLATPRVAWDELGAWSLLPALLMVAGAAAIFGASHRRYHRLHRALAEGTADLPDGVLPALATFLALVLGTLAIFLIGMH